MIRYLRLAILCATLSTGAIADTITFPPNPSLIPPISFQDNSINWPSIAPSQLTYSSFSVNLGGFPLPQTFGGGGWASAITGFINAPTTATGFNATGISGYAITQTPNINAVGLYGQGGVLLADRTGLTGTSTWAYNGVVQNCAGDNDCAANGGISGINAYGAEQDCNSYFPTAAPTPALNLKCIWITGKSNWTQTQLNTNAATHDFNAIQIGSPGIFSSPQLTWPVAVRFNNGAQQTAIEIGTNSIANTSPSAKLLFDDLDSGGTQRQSGMFADALGELQLFGFGGLVVGNGNGAGYFTVSPQNILAAVTFGLTAATWTDTQTCTAGQISVDAGFIYVCTATNTVKRATLATF